MNKKINVIACILAIGLSQLLTIQAGNYGRQYGNSYPRSYFPQQPVQQQNNGSPVGQTPKEYLDSHSGFSTFGIIAIIFVIILSVLIFYYGIMCYPFLCKTDKKYRYVSSTITAATSHSIQSIENFTADQKH